MKFLIIIFVVLISDSVHAQSDYFGDFFIGKYLLVGEALDSDKTYSGKVEIYRENGILKVTRTINGLDVVGTIQIDSTLESNSTIVLRIFYKEYDSNYEQTCLWQSDLDNYPRISCYLYKKGEPTNDPGLEVLFHDHTVN